MTLHPELRRCFCFFLLVDPAYLPPPNLQAMHLKASALTHGETRHVFFPFFLQVYPTSATTRTGRSFFGESGLFCRLPLPFFSPPQYDLRRDALSSKSAPRHGPLFIQHRAFFCFPLFHCFFPLFPVRSRDDLSQRCRFQRLYLTVFFWPTVIFLTFVFHNSPPFDGQAGPTIPPQNGKTNT